jgi:TonB family protein
MMFRSLRMGSVAACMWLGFSSLALAQGSTPSPSPASSVNAPGGLSETTKRQADNPYKWILIMDDKPRPKKDEAVAKDRKPAVPAATSVAAPRPERAAPAAPAAASAPAASIAAVQQPVPSSPLLDPAPPPSPTPLAATTPQLSQSLVEEEPLKLVRQVQPEMTRQIAAADIKQGSVTAKFMVNADGSVGDAQIVTSTNRVLNSPVLAALRQWRYEPRKEPREAQVEFAFDFSK